MPPRYEVIGVEGIGEVRPRDDVAALVIQAAVRQGTPLRAGDVLVISQKIVSKSEGRLLRLDEVTPSTVASAMAAGLGLDVDAPEDLLALLTEGAGTGSHALLTRWRLPERLAGVRSTARA